MNTKTITVSISEDGIWATDAHIRTSRLDASWWDDGATLIGDEDGQLTAADDAIYETIADAISRGETDGRIETDDHVYTWSIA